MSLMKQRMENARNPKYWNVPNLNSTLNLKRSFIN